MRAGPACLPGCTAPEQPAPALCAAQDLLTSYNIGIDRQTRQREDISKSAARAGLQLPEHWDERKAYEGLQGRLKAVGGAEGQPAGGS